MAVTLTGTNGLFTRLGKLLKIAGRVNTHQTNATSGLAAEIEDVVDEYNSADLEYTQDFLTKDSILSWQKSAADVYTAISNIAKSTVIGMVDDDTTLNQKTLLNALDELIDQMGTADDIKGNVFTVSGTGDGGTIISSKGYFITSNTNGEGKAFQNLHEDNTMVVCIKDAQVTGTAGRETFRLKGELAISDIRDPNFPGGNGQNNTISVSDPSYSQQSGMGRNNLANSDFEDFATTDTPDNWTIVTGVAGTGILEEGTVVHRGSKSLQYLGDVGATLLHISQSFNTSGQTTVKLRPETRYCCSFWTRRETAVASGVLRVSVKDGAAAILDSGNAALSVTLSSDAADTWVHHSFTFSSPLDLPDAAAAHVELTTALTSTASVYIDGLQIFRMPHLTNASSFHIAIVPGATDYIEDDEAKITVTKTVKGVFATDLNKFLGLESINRQLPFQTDASETISDSLIS